MMITLQAFVWVALLALPWFSMIADQSADVKEEPSKIQPVAEICQKDTACTLLALMGVCGERFKEKMDQKCPNYCEKCGLNMTNLSEKGKPIPKIVVDNADLLDKEMIDVFKKTATGYHDQVLLQALNAEQKQLTMDPIFMTTEISLTGEKSDAAIDNMDLRQRMIINSPIEIKAQQYESARTQSTAVKDYLENYSKNIEKENKAWLKEQHAQVKRDKIIGTLFKIFKKGGEKGVEKAAGAERFKKHASAITLGGGALLGIAEGIFTLTCDVKTKEVVQFDSILKNLEQLQEMNIKIAVKNEKLINAIRNDIAGLYKFTWAGFNILKARVGALYNDLSRDIGSSTTQILRSKYFSDYKQRVESYVTLYGEYIDAEKTADTTKRLKKYCEADNPPIVTILKTLTQEKNDNAMSDLVKYSNGNIMNLIKFLRNIYSDVDFLTVVEPVCLSLQKFDSKIACERHRNTYNYAVAMKNSIITTLNNYYRMPDTKKVIIDSITNIIGSQAVDNNKNTIQHAVDNVANTLSEKFPSIAFFVYAGDKDKLSADVWSPKEEQEFYVSINRENAQWHVFWHSVEEEPVGTIWEKCYNGNLSDPKIGIWFVNRPRCVRAELVVPKTHKLCDKLFCDIKSDEKIPSCTTAAGKRVQCFRPPFIDEVLDPTDLLNSISKHIPENDGTRKRQKTVELFSSETLGLRTKAELKDLALGYCLTAVISQTSQNIDDFSFSTTMTGAAYPWTYFMDGERLKVHNAKYSEQIVKNIQKYQDKNDEVKEKIKEDCKEDLTKSHCIFNLHSMYLEDAIQQLNNTLITFFPSDSYIQSTLIPSGKFVPLAVLGDTVQLQRELNNSEYIWQDNKRTNIYYRDGHFEIPNVLTAKMTKQLMIFKKCHETRPTLEMLNSDMMPNCLERHEKDLKLTQNFQKQITRFLDKVEDKKKHQEHTKKLGIAFGIIGGIFLIVVAVLIVLVIVRRKRRKSTKAIGFAVDSKNHSKRKHHDDSHSTQNTASRSTQLATTNQSSMSETTADHGKKSKRAGTRKGKKTTGAATEKYTAYVGKRKVLRHNKGVGKGKAPQFNVKAALKKT